MQAVQDSISSEDFKVVQSLIYGYAGIALSDGKRIMVHSRLAKRLRATKFTNFGDYLTYLQSPRGTDERIEFINCLTTNKTDFFRENHHFEFLQQEVFPVLGRQGKLRIWSAACSSGEEPYSIAMCVRESFSDYADTLILATDIDTQVLERAKQGVYREDQIAGVSNSRLRNFFDPIKSGRERTYSVKPHLRELVKFGRLNFNDTKWPMANRFDVIFCRNAMIYFNQATQRRLVERFASLINPGGYLIIGHSESLHGVTDIFEPLGGTVYRLKVGQQNPGGRSSREPATSTGAKLQAMPKSEPVASSKPRDVSVEPESIEKLSIIVGQSHVSSKPIWVTTVLGSCIAACLYDEVAKIGGMNHFMLPSSEFGDRVCGSYGVHAMEILINDLMKQGAHRYRLKAKLFGGGTVVDSLKQLQNVGQRNIDFAREFLSNESIPLVAEKVGGTHAQYVRFNTSSFEAQVKLLNPQTSMRVVNAEKVCATKLKPEFGVVMYL